MFDAIPHSVDDLDGIAISTLFQNGQVDGFLTINANNVVLNGGRVLGVSDIAKTYKRVANRLEWDVIHLGDVRQLSIAVNVVVAWADADVPGGQNPIGIVDCAHHI